MGADERGRVEESAVSCPSGQCRFKKRSVPFCKITLPTGLDIQGVKKSRRLFLQITPRNAGSALTAPFLSHLRHAQSSTDRKRTFIFAFASGDKMHSSSDDLICAVLPLDARDGPRSLSSGSAGMAGKPLPLSETNKNPLEGLSPLKRIFDLKNR